MDKLPDRHLIRKVCVLAARRHDAHIFLTYAVLPQGHDCSPRILANGLVHVALKRPETVLSNWSAFGREGIISTRLSRESGLNLLSIQAYRL